MNAKHIIMILAAWPATAMAQDFHLSHYGSLPQYMNPAQTGLYENETFAYKVYSAYRSQWSALSIKPYKTMAIALDMPKQIGAKQFGFGGLLINNRAGTGGFNTLNFLLSGAYRITKKGMAPHYLAVGLQAGIFYKNFDPAAFTFDSQYTSSAPGGFDTNIPSGENFGKTGLVRFDAGMGIDYKYMEAGKRLHPFTGLSVFHVTRPNESFTGEASKLPMRFVWQGGMKIQVNDPLELSPVLVYMSQGGAHELYINMNGLYGIGKGPYALAFGLGYRSGDAIMFQVGIRQDEYCIRIGYDYNTSFLKSYSGGNGAWELSAIFGISK